MQNACNTAMKMIFQPSVRSAIDIHSIDYDFPQTPTRPAVRTGEDAIKNTVMPDKPAVTQEASSPQGVTTAPSYKAPLSPPSAQDRQQSTTASKTTAALSIKPTSKYTAQTFVDAVRSGCLDSVLRHIDAGLEANVGLTPYGKTPLMHAADCGHEAIVRELLEAGAYVDQARTAGVTALMFAAQNGHTATVQALLGKGATVDQAMPNGETALMFAAQDGHTATVQALLGKGATVDQARTNGWTALIFAAENGHTAIVRALLAQGATVDQADFKGETALIFAAENGHTATVQVLLDNHATVDQAKTGGSTALTFAAQNGHTAIVRALLGKGATVDQATNPHCETPLMIAAFCGHTEIVQLLLKAGANCKLKAKNDYTALSLAIVQKHKEIIKLLRAQEADTSPQHKGFFQQLFG